MTRTRKFLLYMALFSIGFGFPATVFLSRYLNPSRLGIWMIAWPMTLFALYALTISGVRLVSGRNLAPTLSALATFGMIEFLDETNEEE